MPSSPKLSVLHITSWFPSTEQPKRAIWIKRHIKALDSQGITNRIYHVESSPGTPHFSFGKKRGDINRFICIFNRVPWKIYEFISFLLVAFVILKERKNKHNIINFHIAYPNLIYSKWLKLITKTPFIITEHWSAYHFNFGLPRGITLKSIMNIFDSNTPLLAVSKSLLRDIKTFSQNPHIDGTVISNVVDTKLFKVTNTRFSFHRFFMLSNWKEPKNPFPIFRAFMEYQLQHKEAQLYVGGYGSLLEKMKSWVNTNYLSNQILFLGVLDDNQIVDEMNKASAFIHISDYETFSVVCAEAICCGCPVIASNTGGIPEFIDSANGILINETTEILDSMNRISLYQEKRNIISSNAQKLFALEKIGEKYLEVLNGILER